MRQRKCELTGKMEVCIDCNNCNIYNAYLSGIAKRNEYGLDEKVQI